jgi:hypothetical protein
MASYCWLAMTALVAKFETFSSVTFIGFSLFATGILQQCSLLLDCLLHLSSAGSHRYDICLCPSHLLLELPRLGSNPSQALHKRKKEKTTTTEGRRC